MTKNTLNIYEVLEALNNKININTTLIEDNTKQLEDKINQLEDKINQLENQLSESKVYLLDEIDTKSSSNLDFLYKETEKLKNEKQDEFKIYVKNLTNNKIIEIKDLQTLEFQKHTKVYIDKLQQHLISNEFLKLRTDISKDLTKLKTDVSKDLDSIVESVKNIKVF
tara:strand:+ start:310 stop:810 length:501 start_codon:yes stop_codon:yes gene_type:complete